MTSQRGEVKYALGATLRIGESRRAAKWDGTAQAQIVSYATYNTYLDHGLRFYRWTVERHHVRRLVDITPEMVQAYVDKLAMWERSPAYIRTAISALKKLDVGVG